MIRCGDSSAMSVLIARPRPPGDQDGGARGLAGRGGQINPFALGMRATATRAESGQRVEVPGDKGIGGAAGAGPGLRGRVPRISTRRVGFDATACATVVMGLATVAPASVTNTR